MQILLEKSSQQLHKGGKMLLVLWGIANLLRNLSPGKRLIINGDCVRSQYSNLKEGKWSNLGCRCSKSSKADADELPAAGCTRVQASRCDAGVEKPWKPIKNPVSWPSSRLPRGGDEPPAETIRPVQAPSLAGTDSSALQKTSRCSLPSASSVDRLHPAWL